MDPTVAERLSPLIGGMFHCRYTFLVLVFDRLGCVGMHEAVMDHMQLPAAGAQRTHIVMYEWV